MKHSSKGILYNKREHSCVFSLFSGAQSLLWLKPCKQLNLFTSIYL